jgi:hypothetical protein
VLREIKLSYLATPRLIAAIIYEEHPNHHFIGCLGALLPLAPIFYQHPLYPFLLTFLPRAPLPARTVNFKNRHRRPLLLLIPFLAVFCKQDRNAAFPAPAFSQNPYSLICKYPISHKVTPFPETIPSCVAASRLHHNKYSITIGYHDNSHRSLYPFSST